jgi:predicted metal-dependent hydrolase
MTDRIQLGDVAVDVVFKDIKHVHISVYPPDGRVRLAAPAHMSLETLRVFAVSKLGWIKTQQRKLHAQARETPRDILERESHYLWGRRYLLRSVEEEAAPSVTINPSSLVLRIRPGTSQAERDAIMAGWYRRQVRDAVAEVIGTWESILGVRVQRMKTRWGSCNHDARTIRLNTELAKKPLE